VIQGKEPFQKGVGYGIKSSVVVHPAEYQTLGGFQLVILALQRQLIDQPSFPTTSFDAIDTPYDFFAGST
jgi:hypothetical protein